MAETNLAEALFELANVNEEEWGGIFLVHALLLQDSGPPRLRISQWLIDHWKRQPWDPLDLIRWGRSRTETGGIPRRGNRANSNSGGFCFQGGDRDTQAANETGTVEICDPYGEILYTSGLAVLIAL